MAGISGQLTALEVNQAVGQIAKSLNEAMRDVGSMKDFLDTWDDAQLQAFGLTTQDVATIRSAYNDLAQLRDIYLGKSSLAAPYDHRTFAKRIFGFGF